MDAGLADYPRFSSVVRLALHANGQSFDLASIGPNEVIARTPIELEACHADVVMDVDGDRFIWPVRLPRGAVPFDRAIATQPNGEMQRTTAPTLKP
jgi:hypothetical protein